VVKFGIAGLKIEKADGGTFGGKDFSYRPDAIRFYYKRSHGTSQPNEPATVVAYLWKGSYYQANVPGNTAMADATNVEVMENRDRCVLNNFVEGTNVGGERTKSEDAALIGKLIYNIEGDATDWTLFEQKIDYGSFKGTETKPEMLNIIISANDYFGTDRSKIGVDNQLIVDNVELVYYNTLSSLSYDGQEELEQAFNENKLTYDLSTVTYEEGKLHYEKKGQGGTAVKSYDPATGKVVIRVEGDDFSEQYPNSYTEYTINFKPEFVGDYPGTLAVKAFTTPTPLIDKNINIEKGTKEATASLHIKDFSFMGFNIGDIDLTDVPISYDENTQSFILESGFMQTLEQVDVGYGFPMDIPVTLNSAVINAKKQLVAQLNIDVFETSDVIVYVYPFHTSGEGNITITGNIDKEQAQVISYGAPASVNLENATLSSDVTYEDITAANTILAAQEINNNTIFYLPVSSSIEGANVVKDGEVGTLNIHDNVAFNIPTAFTASTISYDRAFATTDNYVSTFVLPFGFTVPEGTTVAEFSEVRGDGVLVFKPVQETEANKPYVVKTTDADFVKNLNLTDVEVAATTGANLTTTVGDYSHIGTYTTQTVNGVFGYQNGAFVYGNGTVNPFRTYIKKDGATAPVKAFSILIEDNELTGLTAPATNSTGNAAIYNLQGIKVGNGSMHRLPKGVYVVNGKKVIVK